MYAESAPIDSLEDKSYWEKYGPGALCGATGFLSAFTVSLGGQMPIGELLLMLVFPWVVIRGYMARGWPTRLQQLGWFQLLLVLATFTAVGYLVSDLYRSTPFNNLVRGWARVGFLLVDLVAVVYLIDSSWQRLRIFVLALYVGRVVDALINGPLFGEWWKFGFGYATTIFAFFFMAGRSIVLQVTVAGGLALLNFVLGARSLGAVCLIIGGLLCLRYVRGVWRPIAFFGSISLAIALSVAANALILENQDHAGSNTERQSMIETSADLFVGSPLIGQGSWFTATGLISKLEERRAIHDPTFRGYTPEEASQLTIHSQLLTALAEGGILGGAFFFGLGALLLKTTRTLMWHAVPCRAFLLFLVLGGLWNLLMSPFSGVARIEIALLVCACLLVILQRQGELVEEDRE